MAGPLHSQRGSGTTLDQTGLSHRSRRPRCGRHPAWLAVPSAQGSGSFRRVQHGKVVRAENRRWGVSFAPMMAQPSVEQQVARPSAPSEPPAMLDRAINGTSES